jgi:hypothetical protein
MSEKVIGALLGFTPEAELDIEEVSRIRAAGYVPVLRWTKIGEGHSVTCTTGEAVANVRAARKRGA